MTIAELDRGYSPRTAGEYGDVDRSPSSSPKQWSLVKVGVKFGAGMGAGVVIAASVALALIFTNQTSVLATAGAVASGVIGGALVSLSMAKLVNAQNKILSKPVKMPVKIDQDIAVTIQTKKMIQNSATIAAIIAAIALLVFGGLLATNPEVAFSTKLFAVVPMQMGAMGLLGIAARHIQKRMLIQRQVHNQ